MKPKNNSNEIFYEKLKQRTLKIEQKNKKEPNTEIVEQIKKISAEIVNEIK